MKKFRLTKYQNAILLKVQQGEQLCVQGGLYFSVMAKGLKQVAFMLY